MANVNNTNRNSNKCDNRKESVKGVTPIGEALFPKLIVPDTKFDPDGTYSLKFRLPDGPEADALISKIDSVAEASHQEAIENAPNPAAARKIKKAEPSYSREYDPQTGEDTGNWLFNFKMKASGVSKRTGRPWERKPAIFDAQRKPISGLKENGEIWNGTQLRVAYELRPFYSPSFGAGCSQILEAVQILKLVSGTVRTADDYGFSVEEGYSQEESTPFDVPAEEELPKSDVNGDADF